MINTVDQASDLFVFQATQRITYSTKKPVPIKEVIIALQGLEGVLKPVPLVLRELTGIEIERSEFLIQSLQAGSLIEDVVVKFFFGDKDRLNDFVKRLGEKQGMRAVVLSAIVAGVAVYGLHWASGQKAAPMIEATNSVIIQNGAGVMNVDPQVFQAAIERAAGGNKRAVAESALRLTAPVRADPASAMLIASDAQAQQWLEISHQAVVEAPARIELEPNERVEELTAVQLKVRATNLDSRKQGWAGKLGVRDERLPIELDPSVAESDLFGRESVWVDAALVFREKGHSRELKPARIYVRKVYSEAP
nr:MAG TPA: hypothetical protein [Caudoviricetes sp.]